MKYKNNNIFLEFMNKIAIPQKMNSELAYLCGILAGDGSIYKRNNKHDYIIKCVGNPADEKDFYEVVIKTLFRQVFNVNIITKNHDSNTTYGFVMHSKQLFDYLVNDIGLPQGRKYNNLKIPDFVKKNKKFITKYLQGLFDTDGCISFKKRYRKEPYYPVISLSSKSSDYIMEIYQELVLLEFRGNVFLDYKYRDTRIKSGFNTISRIELNGHKSLELWMNKISFRSPKHIKKIQKYGKVNSGERI